jgi:serine/threonine protein kinase
MPKLLGPRTDVYGLGAVLFRMLTGRLLFVGEQLEIVSQHLRKQPPRPSAYVKVSVEMEALVMQCLEKHPEARPASMTEVATRLRRLSEEPAAPPPPPPPRRTQEVGLPPRAVVPVEPAPGPPALPATRTARAKRRARRWPLVLATIAFFGGGAAWWVLRGRTLGNSAAVAPAATSGPPDSAASAGSVVAIESEPPGAKIFVNHELQGVTPATLRLTLPQQIKVTYPGRQTVRFVAKKQGPVRIRLPRLE